MIGWPHVTVAVFALAFGCVIGWYVAKKHIVKAGGDMGHLFQRAVSAFLLLLAIGSVVQMTYFQRQQDRQSLNLKVVSDCQYEVNKALIEVLSRRQEPNQKKDEALVNMAVAVVNAKSEADSRAAVRNFVDTMEELNATRARNPYPTIPSDCRPK